MRLSKALFLIAPIAFALPSHCYAADVVTSIIDFPRFVGGRTGLYIAVTMERFQTPKQIPGFGILSDVALNGSDVVTTYIVNPRILDVVRSGISDMQINERNRFCAVAGIRAMFSDGIRFTMRYLAPDNSELGSYSISSCPN